MGNVFYKDCKKDTLKDRKISRAYNEYNKKE